ncbi:JAB domain-containing protein [Staphylococcus saprophyticus]
MQQNLFAHNHPSQDVTPSVNDIMVGKRLKLIGELQINTA